MHARWGKLYRDMTPAELAMEEAVASLGVPYRAQFPYFLYGLRYFLDFLLPTLGVVVEVDDPSHASPDRQIADARRTADLTAEGWEVVRVTNEQALADAKTALLEALTRRRTHKTRAWPACMPAKRTAPRRGQRSARQEAREIARARKEARCSST